MTGDDIGRLAYLGILGAVLIFWFMTQNRSSLGKTMQQAIVWVLIFVGVIAAYGLWGDIRQTVMPQQSVVGETGQIEVPRSADGHYYLTLQVNGTPVTFLVDTGASQVVLTPKDAKRIGIDPDTLAFTSTANTANGEVQTAPIRLDTVALGPFEDQSVLAWVNGGDLDLSLLGMTYLQRWSSVQISNGSLVLTR
jgi:aspartyl protease family protein